MSGVQSIHRGATISSADPHAVRADHGPAAVERPLLRGERGQRAEQDGSEEQRRQDARPENGRHCERHAAVAAAERALGDRRLEGEQHQHEKGEGVADPPTSWALHSRLSCGQRSRARTARSRESATRASSGAGWWAVGCSARVMLSSLSGRDRQPAARVRTCARPDTKAISGRSFREVSVTEDAASAQSPRRRYRLG